MCGKSLKSFKILYTHTAMHKFVYKMRPEHSFRALNEPPYNPI